MNFSMVVVVVVVVHYPLLTPAPRLNLPLQQILGYLM